MSVVQFLVTMLEDGRAVVAKVAAAHVTADNLDPTFDPPVMEPTEWMDLHVKVGKHARLLRVELADDTIPKFDSVEEAERWMAERSQLRVLT